MELATVRCLHRWCKALRLQSPIVRRRCRGERGRTGPRTPGRPSQQQEWTSWWLMLRHKKVPSQKPSEFAEAASGAFKAIISSTLYMICNLDRLSSNRPRSLGGSKHHVMQRASPRQFVVMRPNQFPVMVARSSRLQPFCSSSCRILTPGVRARARAFRRGDRGWRALVLWSSRRTGGRLAEFCNPCRAASAPLYHTTDPR
jgi:hypothetical protein